MYSARPGKSNGWMFERPYVGPPGQGVFFAITEYKCTDLTLFSPALCVGPFGSCKRGDGRLASRRASLYPDRCTMQRTTAARPDSMGPSFDVTSAAAQWSLSSSAKASPTLSTGIIWSVVLGPIRSYSPDRCVGRNHSARGEAPHRAADPAGLSRRAPDAHRAKAADTERGRS